MGLNVGGWMLGDDDVWDWMLGDGCWMLGDDVCGIGCWVMNVEC